VLQKNTAKHNCNAVYIVSERESEVGSW